MAVTFLEQGLRQVAVDRLDGRRDEVRLRRDLVLRVAPQAWLDHPAEQAVGGVVATCFARLRTVLSPGPAREV